MARSTLRDWEGEEAYTNLEFRPSKEVRKKIEFGEFQTFDSLSVTCGASDDSMTIFVLFSMF